MTKPITTDDIRKQYPEAVARGEQRAAEAIRVGEQARAAEQLSLDEPEPDVEYRPEPASQLEPPAEAPSELPPDLYVPEWFRERFGDKMGLR